MTNFLRQRDPAPGHVDVVEPRREVIEINDGPITSVIHVVEPVAVANPSAAPAGSGGTGYHHVQLAPDERWHCAHGLGYRPGGITAWSNAGHIVEPAGIEHADDLMSTDLLFTGRPLSGQADLS